MDTGLSGKGFFHVSSYPTQGNRAQCRRHYCREYAATVLRIHLKPLDTAGSGAKETVKSNTGKYELQILDERKCTAKAFLKKTGQEKQAIMSDEKYWLNICRVRGNNENVKRDGVQMEGKRQLYRLHVTDSGYDPSLRIYEIKLYEKTDFPFVPVRPDTPDPTAARNIMPGTCGLKNPLLHKEPSYGGGYTKGYEPQSYIRFAQSGKRFHHMAGAECR